MGPRGDSREGARGGRIRFKAGQLITDEWSGHYGRLWTPEIRSKFTAFMKNHGVTIIHEAWRPGGYSFFPAIWGEDPYTLRKLSEWERVTRFISALTSYITISLGVTVCRKKFAWAKTATCRIWSMLHCGDRYYHR